jgi:hypothetical protein
MKFFPRTDAEGTRRLFWIVLFATGVFKLGTAIVLPLTGDEAYFVTWGRNPALGYYDHGAMTGWWLAAMLWFGDAEVWLRLPAVAMSLFVGVIVRSVLRPVDPHLADLAAILWLLSPANLLCSLITTDTPLMFFSVLAVVAALRAERSPRGATGWWLLSGLCLGAAFLSKYFAVLTGLGLGVWLVFGGPPPRLGALALLLVGAAPGIAINVAWNEANGWANVLFNVSTRNSDAGFNPVGFALYVLFAVVLMGPMAFRVAKGRPSLWRERIGVAVRRWKETGLVGIALAGFVPLLVLGVVSFIRNVGIHWLLSFVPWVIAALAIAMKRESLQRLIRPALIYAVVLVVLGAVLLSLPIELLRWHDSYGAMVVGSKTGEVMGQIEPIDEGYTLAADSYGIASLLAYHTRSHVPVFGMGSYHGRHDDWVTDFRQFDGKDVIVVTSRRHRAERMPAWFAESEIREIEVRGGTIFVCRGHGFRYDNYRETILRPVAERYYPMPDWLERIAEPSPFVRRYELQEP